MRLSVTYDIKDILCQCQTRVAEKTGTEEDVPIVKDVIKKMDKLYSACSACMYLFDGQYFVSISYQSYLGIENKELTVNFCKDNGIHTDIRSTRIMSRTSVYKLVKEVLENGLNEYIYQEVE